MKYFGISILSGGFFISKFYVILCSGEKKMPNIGFFTDLFVILNEFSPNITDDNEEISQRIQEVCHERQRSRHGCRPVIGVLTGGVNFSDHKWIIQQSVTNGEEIVTPEVAVTWGAFVQTVFDFIIIAFCIFVAIKFINRLKKAPEPQPEAPAAPAGPTETELLTEIRDLLKDKK